MIRRSAKNASRTRLKVSDSAEGARNRIVPPRTKISIGYNKFRERQPLRNARNRCREITRSVTNPRYIFQFEKYRGSTNSESSPFKMSVVLILCGCTRERRKWDLRKNRGWEAALHFYFCYADAAR